MHYYYTKYPYLNYNYRDTDGWYTMFSIPPEMLVVEFVKIFLRSPKSFFDCGAATGVIVRRAQKLGMDARGIDVKKYPYMDTEELFKSGKIQIKSILDCDPIHADIVYCNGTLTYFTETELPGVLDKFKTAKSLFAIHNTTEDVLAARDNGDELTTCNKPRLIKPREWWMRTFNKNGFTPRYIDSLQCFCAIPQK